MTTQLIKGLTGIFVGDFQTERQFTPEGFLVAPANISRTGIQDYRARELGLPGVEAEKIIKMYRPAEEVFKPESIASFEAASAADNHPVGDITANNWKRVAVGDVHDLAANGEYLRAGKVIIRDQATIEKVIGGKSQLSCGYTFDADMTPGTTAGGQKYDGIQRNIRGNHIAIVDAGRAGANVRISDRDPSKGPTLMLHKIKIGDQEFNVELDENVGRAARDAMDRHDRAMGDGARALKDCKDALKEAKNEHMALQKDHDAVVKERDSAVKELAGYKDSEADPDEDSDEDSDEDGDASDNSKKTGDAAIKIDVRDRYKKAVARCKALKAKLPTPAQDEARAEERAQLLTQVKALVGDAVDAKGKSIPEIRVAVVSHVIAKDAALKPLAEAVLSGVAIEKAPEATIKSVFAALLTQKKIPATGANDAAARAAAQAVQDAADRETGRRMAGGGGSSTGTGSAKPATIGGRTTWLDTQMKGAPRDAATAE